MINFKEEIKKIIYAVDKNIGDIQVTRPPKEEMGDYCVPCFTLNINDLNNPHEKAEFLKSNIDIDDNLITEVSVIGPYLNFRVNKSTLADTTIKEILSKKEKYGSSQEGKGKNLLIEHTSINPNASPHIGRTRNSLIGDFLANLFEFQGYKVEKHYFINDIGKQIAMLLIGVEEKTNNFSEVSFDDMLSIYIDINQKSKEDPSVEKKAFSYLHELESGNREIINKFKQLTDICVEGQKSIFSKMNISWDIFTHESDFVYEKTTDLVLNKLKELGKLKEDENSRYYVDLSGYNIPTKNPVLVLTREDKTSLYPLRDIAYTMYKEERNSENNYIVLGEDQEVYMKQIAAVMDIMGYNAPKLVSYNFVLLNGGKMATREGKVVLLEDFIEEMKERIKEGFDARNSEYDDQKVSSIAASCIKYNMLNVNRKRDVNFNLDDAVNFQGDSAMYLLYNYARICSILEKNDKKLSVNKIVYDQDIENSLISYLYDFSDVIESACKNEETIGLTNYLHELAQKFSKYYNMVPILNEESEELKNSRLLLLECLKTVLENGMKILGIEPMTKL